MLVYDPAAHALSGTLPKGGTVKLKAPAGIHLSGPTTIEGSLHVTDQVTADAKLHVSGEVVTKAKLTASDDVVGAGISLKSHKHSGVQPGGGMSGAPV